MKLKNQESGFFFCQDGTYDCFIDSIYAFFIDTTCGFFIDKCYNWERSQESGKSTKGRILPLLALPFVTKILGNRVTRVEKGYKKICHTDKGFSPTLSFK